MSKKSIIGWLVVCLIMISSTVFLSCFSQGKHNQISGRMFSDSIYCTDIYANSSYVIDKIIDLEGCTFIIPENVVLNFIKRGQLVNGRVVGNNTCISGLKKDIFRNIEINGTWNVPFITSSFFQDKCSINVLKNVMALSSPFVMNTIEITPGNYKVSVSEKSRDGIIVYDHTKIILNGTVSLLPNDLNSYNVVHLMGNDITIEGCGTIQADKEKHLGTDGEWGHGIKISGDGNVVIKGIDIKDCWGDCIYVRSKGNIQIFNCSLDNGRRQGISITSADSVFISNCKITNVSGMSPQYAIDVEPNIGDTIQNVVLDNIVINNCKGGIVASARAADSYIRKMSVAHCQVEGQKFYPFFFNTVDTLLIENCMSSKSQFDLYTININALEEKDNRIINVKNIVK